MYRLRQQGIVTRQQLAALGDVVQIGAGGIGSASALALAKLGVPALTVYDFDVLEAHNVGNQFLPESFLGQPKVHALDALLKEMAPDCHYFPVPEKWTGQRVGNVMIVTVDSMDGRMAIWQQALASAEVDIFIDGRMGAETLRLYTIDMHDRDHITFYEASLYPDEEAVQEPCTARGIVYTSMIAGAQIANTIKRLALFQTVKREQIYLIALNQILGQ